jgi:copper chaperone CopZ
MKVSRKQARAGRPFGPEADATTAARVTERFAVPGVDCPSCATGIRSALKALPGFQSVAVNVPAQEAAVTFDPGRLSRPAIRARLDEIGYGCK